MTRLEEKRTQLGMSRAELATKARVSTATVYAVEGGRPCRPSTRRNLLKALGLTMENQNDYFEMGVAISR